MSVEEEAPRRGASFLWQVVETKDLLVSQPPSRSHHAAIHRANVAAKGIWSAARASAPVLSRPFSESYGLTSSLTMPAAVTTASAESAAAAAKTTIMSLSKAAASAPA